MHCSTRSPAHQGGPSESAELTRAQRLTRSRHFREAYDGALRFTGRLITLWLRNAPGGALRLGVVASRRVGNAVCRARAKRLMREAYRLNRFRFCGRCDVVLSARGGIVRGKRQDVEAELLVLARRAGIMKPDGGAAARAAAEV